MIIGKSGGFPQLVEAKRSGVKGTKCPWTAIEVGALGGMTEGMVRNFKPNKEIGKPSPVFIVNQGNTNQSIATRSKR